MGSGILELIQQSQYSNQFNIEPQITFFRIIYHKYTHYCKESVIEYFDDTPSWGGQVSLTLSKVGDLIHKMYLVCELSLNNNRKLTIEEINNSFINIDITQDPLKTLIENIVNEASSLTFNLVYDLIEQLNISDIIDKIRSGTLINYSNENNIHNSDIKLDVNLDESFYTVKPIHLENQAENENNLITVKELLELFDKNEIYRAYLLMDYLYKVQS